MSLLRYSVGELKLEEILPFRLKANVCTRTKREKTIKNTLKLEMRQKTWSTGTMYFGTIFEGEWWGGRKKSYFKLRL